MKIALSPQWTTPKINQQICASKNIQNGVQNSDANLSAFSFDNRAIFLSFGAIKKINKPEDFTDVDKTAEYLENKIQLSLKEKDADDIKKIIKSVSKKTGANKKLVTETLGRLVQFSSFAQIDNLTEQLNNNDIINFYFSGHSDCNHLFDFLYGKNLMPLKGNKLAYVIDDYNIQWLNGLDKEKSKLFARINKAQINDDIDFIVLDGFSVNVNGKAKSYNLFGADEDLEKLTCKIVEEVQKTGKSLDDIFYKDKVENIKSIFGENAHVAVIKNPAIQEYNPKNIASIMKPNYPSKQQIKAVLDVWTGKLNRNPDNDDKLVSKLLANYLDNMLNCYSVESLNQEFKDMYSLIENKVSELNKSMDDVEYIIPNDKKSFKFITDVFAKVNNIPDEKIKLNDGKNNNFEKGKVYVILDDFFGSGHSVMGQAFDYYSAIENIYFSKKKDSINFLFVPVLCMGKAMQNILDDIKTLNRTENDFLLAKKVSDFTSDMTKDLSPIETMILMSNVGAMGYEDTLSCAVFPYSFPDNNSNFAALFSSFFFPSLQHRQEFQSSIDSNWSYIFNYPQMYQMVLKECENENK